MGKRFVSLLAIVFAVAVVLGCDDGSKWLVRHGAQGPCTIYETFGATPENSLIAAKIKDPCVAQRLLGTAVKLPAVWGEKKYTDEFEKFAKRVEEFLEKGISYARLQEIVVEEVSRLNTRAGMVLIILSDELFVFGGDHAEIFPVDVALLRASVHDLRAKVAQMAAVVK